MKHNLTPIDDLGCSFATKSLPDFNYTQSQTNYSNRSHVGLSIWDDDDYEKVMANDARKKLDESRTEGIWISHGVTKWDDDIKRKTIHNEAREFKNMMQRMKYEGTKKPIAIALGIIVAILVFVLFGLGLYYFLTKGNSHVFIKLANLIF